MNKYVVDTLKEAKDNNKMVSIHTNPFNQSKCNVGYVDEVNGSWVRIRSVSPEGEDDGCMVISVENIYRIGIDSKYTKKVELIKKNLPNVFKAIDFSLPMESNIVYTTLKEAQKKELVVILWTQDERDSIIGYVKEFDLDTVKILSLDEFGENEGLDVVSLDEIIDIACNDRKCQMVKFLNKIKD
jgi:pimeloyl-CoA synthetase